MQNIVNNRQDIEALPPAQKAEWLDILAASIHRHGADGEIITTPAMIERFGYTVDDFPAAPIAAYDPPEEAPAIPPAVLALADAHAHGIAIPFGKDEVKLACGDYDRALFSSALTLYRTAEDLLPDDNAKAAFRGSEVVFADAGGVSHSLTITQARGLLVYYGSTYQALWAAAAQAATQ